MHKGVILLVKAEDSKQARFRADRFMGAYRDIEWDWYVIGGRWSGTLIENEKKFKEGMIDIYRKMDPEFKDDGFISYNLIEREDVQKALQELWESLGEKSLNPVSRDGFLHYSGKQIKTKYSNPEPYDGMGQGQEFKDDIMPLKDCLKAVKDYGYDPEEKSKQYEKEAQEYLNKDDWDDKTKAMMRGFKLKEAGRILREDFCFETNVYNVEEFNYSIPENPDGYYAVMIDMHN